MTVLIEKTKIKSIASRVRSSQILGDWIPDYYNIMCRKAHATEFRNEYFVVDVIERFAVVYKEHSYESVRLVGSFVPRVDHLHQGVRRTGAG